MFAIGCECVKAGIIICPPPHPTTPTVTPATAPTLNAYNARMFESFKKSLVHNKKLKKLKE